MSDAIRNQLGTMVQDSLLKANLSGLPQIADITNRLTSEVYEFVMLHHQGKWSADSPAWVIAERFVQGYLVGFSEGRTVGLSEAVEPKSK